MCNNKGARVKFQPFLSQKRDRKLCIFYNKLKYNIISKTKCSGGGKVKLKEYRENKGYTQQEMADILGITQQAYSNKEVGKRGFNIKELLILQKVLGVNISDIYEDLSKEIDKRLNRGNQGECHK